MLDPKKYRMKSYIHFDQRISFEKVKDYVTDPKWVASHSFLPFIWYVSSFDKYSENECYFDCRPVKHKERNIMYAGHLDNFIYKYYGERLNEQYYDDWAEKHGIDECSIAYRDNKIGKSNIDFAAEVITRIVDYKNTFILVGDFTQFFDKIDHMLLKRRLTEVIGTDRLEDDWYNVFKSITKYGFYSKAVLIKRFGSDKTLKSNKKYSYFKDLNDFRKYQRKNPCDKNNKTYGIPQGTAISAVCANVYASAFDIALNEIAIKHNGIYRRYSDDFILVIPAKQEKEFTQKELRKIEARVRSLADQDKIEIQEEKTGLFQYSDNQIVNLDSGKNSHLDYLGFVFDGVNVKMRGKSPYKFYRKAYELIGRAQHVKEKKNLTKIPYKRKIYSLYTELGKQVLSDGKYANEHGNFIAYAENAQHKFDCISPKTTNLMMEQIRNRKKKIEKKLGIRLHKKL